jgi:transcriptional regulator with XRE-family HTH domain
MKKRSIALALAAALLFLGAVNRLEEGRRAEGVQQLETALRRTAVSCYASEGFYPPDVAYMQENYGLQYDEETYVIRYERPASNWMPDITVLKAIADLFSVPLDYLVQETHEDMTPALPESAPAPHKRRNHIIITLLSVLIVWFIATLSFVTLDMTLPAHWARYLVFLYSLPISCIVWLVFNSIWGRRIWNLYIISILMWSILLSVFLGVTVYTDHNIWIIFIIGIPAQIVISLCFGIRTGHKVINPPRQVIKRVRSKTAKESEPSEEKTEA